jgi:hypothetical protein
MYVDWSKFLPALVLLLVPIAVFHGKRVRYRAIMREWDGYWGRTFALGLHAIDFVRAGLGAWLLVEALKTGPDAHGVMKYAVILTQAAVLAISTAVQALYCKESEAALAPFTFAAGLLVGFLPALMASYTSLLIALLALILTIVLSAGSRTGAAYFPVLAIAVAGLTFLFTGKRHMLPLGGLCAAIALPWLLTLLFPRHFVVAYLTKATPAEPPKK